MSYLDEMREKYGSVINAEYNKAVTILKRKIDEASSKGKTCCIFVHSEDIINNIMADPEFEGFVFKQSYIKPDNPNYISKLVCWSY